MKSEGADSADPAAQSLVWGYYHEKTAEQCFVGGENIAEVPLCIEVTTPEGALTEKKRRILVAEIGHIADDLIGIYANSLNHWVMLHEQIDGTWGGAGNIFRLNDIKTAMNIPTS